MSRWPSCCFVATFASALVCYFSLQQRAILQQSATNLQWAQLAPRRLFAPQDEDEWAPTRRVSAAVATNNQTHVVHRESSGNNSTFTVGVGFLFPSGLHRRGFWVSLYSACLSASRPQDTALYVLLRESDTKYIDEITQHWQASELKCPLRAFAFSSEPNVMDWDAQFKKLDTRLDGDAFDFVQHVNLPAELGKRGVDLALVVDSDVLFQGTDPIKTLLEGCAAALVASPDHIGCARYRERLGWNFGAWVVNASRWATEDFDKKLWAFAVGARLAGDRRANYADIRHSQTLINKYMKRQEVQLSWVDTLMVPGETPCHDRITHFGGPRKPWNAAKNCLRKKDHRAPQSHGSQVDCEMWAYCQWQDMEKLITKIRPFAPGLSQVTGSRRPGW